MMPRDGAITFRDIVGKLEILRVECDKCAIRLTVSSNATALTRSCSTFEPEADCPRKIARNDYDPCGARCPDLSKVV